MTSPFGPPCMQRPGIARLTSYVRQPPHPAQRVFLMLNTLEAFYGGAAGGAKSSALLMGALQFVDVPRYAALILRKTYSDLTLPGALIDRSHEWLDDTDAIYHSNRKTWEFPGGGSLTFGYLESEKDKNRYRSAEFQYIAFDELTQFTETQYRFLFSRLRRPALPCVVCNEAITLGLDDRWHHAANRADTSEHAPEPNPASVIALGRSHDGVSILQVPLRMRSASNPGDVGHTWVRRRFVDEKSREARSVFIPSKLEDNPSVDPDEYTRALQELDPINWQRLRYGDWTVRDPGELFDASRVAVVGEPYPNERHIVRVRYWDLASTDVEVGTDPDETAGALLAFDTVTGLIRLEHMVAIRKEPHEVEQILLQTARRDGRNIPIVIEMEGGASGKSLLSHYRRNVLREYYCDGDRPTGPKEARIRMLAPKINNGEFSVVGASWSQAFLDQLDAYPHVPHDDQVDALAGAFNRLTAKGARVLV